jgi:Acyl-CoA synthetases (AMP-forming)/AMP-acid ligases II
MYINDLLIRQKDSTKIAIKQGDDILTYEHWYNESMRISSVISNEVFPGSKCIAIFLPNSINYALAYFGILFSNRVIIPIGTQAKYPEIESYRNIIII